MAPLIGLLLILSTNINNPKSAQNITEAPKIEVIERNYNIYAPPINTSEDNKNSRFLINTEKTVVLSVPYTHQIDDLPENKEEEIGTTACGPSAIQMILQYFGENYTLYEVIEKLPTSVYVRGKMFYNLYDGPKQFGYEVTKIKSTPESFFQTLKKGQPIILNIQNYDGITGHAIVIVGIQAFDGKNAKSLIVHDPYVEGYRSFDYITDTQLQQPEGYINYFGNLEPFVINEK